MPRLSMLPTLIREVVGPRTLPREPEPDLIMDGADQVKAYAEAGRADGLMAAGYLFQSAQVLATIADCKLVVDLGCGPATQLAQIAAFQPQTRFLGLDLSEEMLEKGRDHIRAQGLSNVELRKSDITSLDSIDNSSVDGVISTLTLHHLPSAEHLHRCFHEVARVLRPDGAIYVADFARLKSLKSVIYFAYMNADQQPHIFSLDYERSLRAAFCHVDLQECAGQNLSPRAQVFTTFLIPFITIIQTPVRPLNEEIRYKLKEMQLSLSARYRDDLDELRSFFRHGGLPYDPFR